MVNHKKEQVFIIEKLTDIKNKERRDLIIKSLINIKWDVIKNIKRLISFRGSDVGVVRFAGTNNLVAFFSLSKTGELGFFEVRECYRKRGFAKTIISIMKPDITVIRSEEHMIPFWNKFFEKNRIFDDKKLTVEAYMYFGGMKKNEAEKLYEKSKL